jgi:Rho-binding antiterminator
MTAYKPQDALAHWTVQDMLRQCLISGRMVEVVYRDSAGQVCIAHDVIRDLFNRAGRDFILLGRGALLSLDHVLTIDGLPPCSSCG